jgi:2-oxoglutarate dehydrogenase E2 component (dihydrolipoamide succinyltransferase)
MAVDVQIPALGESISEGVIVRWIKHSGDVVTVDEPLFELETDKASVEIPAPSGGRIEVIAPEGATVRVGEVVARIDGSGAASGAGERKAASNTAAAAPAATAPPPQPTATAAAAPEQASTGSQPLSPAVRRLVEEHQLDPGQISGSGRSGRLTKGDVLAHLKAAASDGETASAARQALSAVPSAARSDGAQSDVAPAAEAPRPPTPYPPRPDSAREARPSSDADVERVPMTRLRQRIAERLRQAQATAAILTTFNEVDMSAVMELRARLKNRFNEVHGVPLGFMSFFARASIMALQNMPLINAQIDGTDIVYFKRAHLGIAVGTPRGLVVPVVHNADLLSFAEIEREIARLAALARDNKLGIDDLTGGTFTISNGGVYGSLMSTPILNPPQSAILGMHKIEKRAVVVDDQVVIRPMMYLALSYDHRLIDGADAVSFLVQVKERLEDPGRLLLGV